MSQPRSNTSGLSPEDTAALAEARQSSNNEHTFRISSSPPEPLLRPKDVFPAQTELNCLLSEPLIPDFGFQYSSKPTTSSVVNQTPDIQAGPGNMDLPLPWDDQSPTLGLPKEAKERKATPIYSGVLAYFPLALAEVSRVSKAGSVQHGHGDKLYWEKGKSTDHADSLVRHLMEAGTVDTDGQLHTAKVAWRALALLQTELERNAN